ncbi:MAG: phosphoglucosamine mutase [Oligoflexales bacterium]|nr:phosphoglucosamine mutase [Oligoflexales bacterium]
MRSSVDFPMLSPQKLFGTDGIRGKANVFPMSPDLVLRLGQAIGLYFKRHYSHPRIVIGKDTRISGYMLEQALSSGICSVGVETFFLGPLPTPGIAYMTRGMRMSAGIVISASHNPYSDNGIKIFSGSGYKIQDAIEEELERMVYSENFTADLPRGEKIGKTSRIDDAVGQYAVFLKEQFPKRLSLEGLRIVLDCANGAAYKVAPKVFEELGASVFVTGDSPDGTNINESCGALHPKNLVEKVKLHGADIGLAFDGDADRLIVIDEKGEILDGDEILAICASYYSEKGKLNKNTVVSTIMGNMGLEVSMEKLGIKTLRTKVGDRYVMEEMQRGNFNLGGEQSGHLIFSDVSTTGDGILAALCLLEILLEKGEKIGHLKTCMHKFPQVLKNIDVPARIPISELPELSKHIRLVEQILGNRGRVLFRYSGTELKARIMIEGDSTENIHVLVDELAAKASQCIQDSLTKSL